MCHFQDAGSTVSPSPEPAAAQNDEPLASDRDLFIDDDGSGLEPDESSGSGWGPGPGVDDEDARAGSGDAPEDDEDFVVVTPPPAAPTTAEAPDVETVPSSLIPVVRHYEESIRE